MPRWVVAALLVGADALLFAAVALVWAPMLRPAESGPPTTAVPSAPVVVSPSPTTVTVVEDTTGPHEPEAPVGPAPGNDVGEDGEREDPAPSATPGVGAPGSPSIEAPVDPRPEPSPPPPSSEPDPTADPQPTPTAAAGG